ncbi:hypothetical protein COL922a_013764, partial [Colletotrichum nupharicola]
TLTRNNKLRETSCNFNRPSLPRTIPPTSDNSASNLTSLKKPRSSCSTKDSRVRSRMKSS